jgi:hypothetical protein
VEGCEDGVWSSGKRRGLETQSIMGYEYRGSHGKECVIKKMCGELINQLMS